MFFEHFDENLFSSSLLIFSIFLIFHILIFFVFFQIQFFVHFFSFWIIFSSFSIDFLVFFIFWSNHQCIDLAAQPSLRERHHATISTDHFQNHLSQEKNKNWTNCNKITQKHNSKACFFGILVKFYFILFFHFWAILNFSIFSISIFHFFEI